MTRQAEAQVEDLRWRGRRFSIRNRSDSWRSELVRSVELSLSGIASVSLKSLSPSKTALSDGGRFGVG